MFKGIVQNYGKQQLDFVEVRSAEEVFFFLLIKTYPKSEYSYLECSPCSFLEVTVLVCKVHRKNDRNGSKVQTLLSFSLLITATKDVNIRVLLSKGYRSCQAQLLNNNFGKV